MLPTTIPIALWQTCPISIDANCLSVWKLQCPIPADDVHLWTAPLRYT